MGGIELDMFNYMEVRISTNGGTGGGSASQGKKGLVDVGKVVEGEHNT